ncbi:peptidoglycan/LPS O-acetylase OafA/YrhL [Arcicella aurantiaca]|uniref:Peptidoglycan/LPS O-acetylase OafA/YrhL n=1 Tax=Arcicella aurantiaca TaxID=591202 RepID=A0A316E9J5_9BACT|nr:acyltransferase [Arcicella aurantiaca]PWK27428.1 peptidoglycan/LPS O-acetylase OafA/YrhL [Arcicella aurantiaca]
MSVIPNNRNQAIDFLRAIAVSLTLFRHYGINLFMYKIGWVGVDLFFVLSGFLVSGLLFGEFKKTGKIDFLRFFVRRGLKIYPLFYLLIIIYVIQTKIDPIAKIDYHAIQVEALFYKNYVGGNAFWIHTWSIDVEEHFYLLLPLLFLTLIFFNKSSQKPFKVIPYLFAVIALICLALRTYVTLTQPFSHTTNVSPTHLRIDSLLFGTLLSYFYHFHRDQLTDFVINNRQKLRIGSLILLLPCAIFWDENPQMTTWGFTSLYLGFGGILLLSIYSEIKLSPFLEKIYNGMAKMGLYSYSMYIIHWPLIWWFILPNGGYLDAHYPVKLLVFFVYFGVVYLLGWLLSKTIEIPFLALRDKLFPANSKSI